MFSCALRGRCSRPRNRLAQSLRCRNWAESRCKNGERTVQVQVQVLHSRSQGVPNTCCALDSNILLKILLTLIFIHMVFIERSYVPAVVRSSDWERWTHPDVAGANSVLVSTVLLVLRVAFRLKDDSMLASCRFHGGVWYSALFNEMLLSPWVTSLVASDVREGICRVQVLQRDG